MNLVPAALHVLGDTAARAVVVAAFLLVAALQVHRLDDGDTWWHLATGRLIAETLTIPDADPFSYTAPGAPWINRQWLFDLGLYGAWQAGGATGSILAAGTFFAAAFGALFVVLRRRLPAWAAAIALFLATSCAVERFTARPEAVSFCLLALYIAVLDGRPLRRAYLAALVPLHVLWANCHSLSVLGLAAIGAELAGAIAGRWLPLPTGWRAASRCESRTLLWLAIVAAGATAAEVATPFGVSGALFPLRLLGVIRGAEVTSSTIVEHRPTVLSDLSPQAALGMVTLLALATVAAILSRRRLRLSHALLAGGFVALAILARRNVALVGPGVLPLVASGFGPVLAAAERRLATRPVLRAVVAASLALALCVATAGVVTGRYYETARLTRTFGLGESRLFFSAAAVDFLDAHAPAARAFNDDMLGGYLLWRTYPRRRVFIDARLQVYPAAVYSEYQAVLDDPRNFAAVAARYGITAAILYHPAPGRLELARGIAAVPGWHVAYVDGGAVILLNDLAHRGPAAGTTGPPMERYASALDRLLAAGRPPVEQAIAHFQRGRALLYLLGRDGIAPARADFQAALRLWPGLEEAVIGLAATGGGTGRAPSP